LINSVRVEGNRINLFEVLKVSPLSQNIDNSVRQKQLDIYRADKRIREREGIEPDRRTRKRYIKKRVAFATEYGDIDESFWDMVLWSVRKCPQSKEVHFWVPLELPKEDTPINMQLQGVGLGSCSGAVSVDSVSGLL